MKAKAEFKSDVSDYSTSNCLKDSVEECIVFVLLIFGFRDFAWCPR